MHIHSTLVPVKVEPLIQDQCVDERPGNSDLCLSAAGPAPVHILESVLNWHGYFVYVFWMFVIFGVTETARPPVFVFFQWPDCLQAEIDDGSTFHSGFQGRNCKIARFGCNRPVMSR